MQRLTHEKKAATSASGEELRFVEAQSVVL